MPLALGTETPLEALYKSRKGSNRYWRVLGSLDAALEVTWRGLKNVDTKPLCRQAWCAPAAAKGRSLSVRGTSNYG